MIRDVTDKVRIEQTEVKKKKDKEGTSRLQENLSNVFLKHCEEVNNLCKLLEEGDTEINYQNIADVKRSNYDLFIELCKYNDLINIQNDTFCTEII